MIPLELVTPEGNRHIAVAVRHGSPLALGSRQGRTYPDPVG